MTAPLYLHIGLQKTGTSYLQGSMERNRDVLAGQGLDLVPATRRDRFELMLLVRGRYQVGRDPDSTAASLTRFRDALERHPDRAALLSQESLAACKPEQIETLLAACAGREVHVIASVRDLGRQLPSSWQQELKAGKSEHYRRYLRRLREAQQAGSQTHPWIHLDPPQVLARWAAHVPADHIHVVTVPPRGGDPSQLLQRFCATLDIPTTGFAPEPAAVNTSLGRVQAEVLRRVNAELPDPLLRRQVYGDIGKRFLSSRVLAVQPARRILVPNEFRAWCEEVTEQHIAALGGAGYRVAGDIEDLRPSDEAFGEDVRPTDEEIGAAAVTALARILALRAESGERRPRSRASSPRRRRFFRLGR